MTDKQTQTPISIGEKLEVGSTITLGLQNVQAVVKDGVVMDFTVYSGEEQVLYSQDLVAYTISADDAEKELTFKVNVLAEGSDDAVEVFFTATVGSAPEVDEEALAAEEEQASKIGQGSVVAEEEQPLEEKAESNETMHPEGSVLELLDRYENGSSSTLATLAKVLRDYRSKMGSGCGFNFDLMHDQQCQLWSATRQALSNPVALRDAMYLINAVLAENYNGAFSPVAMQRTIHTVKSRLNDNHRKAFVNLFSLLYFAAISNDKAAVKKNFDLQKTISEEVFDPQTRARLIGYFY